MISSEDEMSEKENNQGWKIRVPCEDSQYEVKKAVRRGPLGRDGEDPPKSKKIVVENWYYFPELQKMTMVLYDRRENGEISIFLCDFLMFFEIFL